MEILTAGIKNGSPVFHFKIGTVPIFLERVNRDHNHFNLISYLGCRYFFFAFWFEWLVVVVVIIVVYVVVFVLLSLASVDNNHLFQITSKQAVSLTDL